MNSPSNTFWSYRILSSLCFFYTFSSNSLGCACKTTELNHNYRSNFHFMHTNEGISEQRKVLSELPRNVVSDIISNMFSFDPNTYIVWPDYLWNGRVLIRSDLEVSCVKSRNDAGKSGPTRTPEFTPWLTYRNPWATVVLVNRVYYMTMKHIVRVP